MDVAELSLQQVCNTCLVMLIPDLAGVPSPTGGYTAPSLLVTLSFDSSRQEIPLQSNVLIASQSSEINEAHNGWGWKGP